MEKEREKMRKRALECYRSSDVPLRRKRFCFATKGMEERVEYLILFYMTKTIQFKANIFGFYIAQ